jgi:hypothetical protein
MTTATNTRTAIERGADEKRGWTDIRAFFVFHRVWRIRNGVLRPSENVVSAQPKTVLQGFNFVETAFSDGLIADSP